MNSGRDCGGYEVHLQKASSARELLPRETSTTPIASSVPSTRPWITSLDAQAFDYFRIKTVPALAGHFSGNVWERLVLQLSQRQPVVHHASVALGSLLYFRSSGPGCLSMSKTAAAHRDLALSSYGRAVAGLRSYIEDKSTQADEEVTLVVLISCLLFVCFEMLQADQKSVISHLVKGLRILFASYRPTMCSSATMRPVILGTDFPDMMDSLADVFVRLDADSTMFGRRSTYLCTSCRCCCQGSTIKIIHRAFTSLKEARSHLDLLTSNALRLRGTILKVTEQFVGEAQGTELFTDPSGNDDWARRYCNLHAMSRVFDLASHPGGSDLVSKQAELIAAFDAWNSAFAILRQTESDDLALTMLEIERFFPWFIVSTLRDQNETSCDRFHADFVRTIELADRYMNATSSTARSCGFALESGILRSVYLVGLKCRDGSIRRRAIDLLRDATVQEGLWSGKVFAAYLQKVIEVEERQARAVRPDLAADGLLTYEDLPETARMHDVVLASDNTRPRVARLVCAQHVAEDGSDIKFIEDEFQLLSV